MSDEPQTDRTYAYFRVVGTDNIDEITKLLNLSPSDAWNLGDPFEKNNHTFFRRSSCWKLNSGLTDCDSLDAHVDSILKKLRSRREALLTLKTQFKTQIICVSFTYQSFSWELDFDHQRQATALGIGFWFDAYNLGDVHNEVTELRQQVNSKKNNLH